MPNCPFFECLDYPGAKCSKHSGCEGCPTYSDCEHCSRQETVIDGTKVPCEYKKTLSSSPIIASGNS